MFDLAWSEIAVIGIVALIAIGPKDLPVAIRAISEMMKKARRMASEFQGHVDEMVRESNLHEVRDQFNDIRNLDIKGRILNAVDNDGSIQRTMSGTTAYTPPLPETAVAAHEPHAFLPADASAMIPGQPAPSMIPPDAAPTTGSSDAVPALGPKDAVPALGLKDAVPAMIPPDAVPVAVPAPAMIPPAEAARPVPH